MFGGGPTTASYAIGKTVAGEAGSAAGDASRARFGVRLKTRSKALRLCGGDGRTVAEPNPPVRDLPSVVMLGTVLEGAMLEGAVLEGAILWTMLVVEARASSLTWRSRHT